MSKSGPIRSAFGLLKAKLASQKKKAVKILSEALPTDPDALSEHEDNFDLIVANIESVLESIDGKNREWQNLIMALKTEEEISAEQVLYDEAAVSDNGFLVQAEDAKEVLIRMRLKKKRWPRVPTAGAGGISSHRTEDGGSGSNGSKAVHVKLPKIVLPKFDGDFLKWPEFWSIFSSNVHSKDISGVEKFTYLLAQLEGKAHDSIKGILVTDDNYELAISVLKERYERPSADRVAALYAQLKVLPVSDRQIMQQRKTYDDCEAILRQLEAAGENVNSNHSLTIEVLSKYPARTVTYLQQHYQCGIKSDLDSVRKTLQKYLTESEDISSALENLQQITGSGTYSDGKKEKDSKSGKLKPGDDMRDNGQGSSSAFMTTNPRNTGNKPLRKCLFCGGNHFNSECEKYPDVASRLSMLCKLNRCFRCTVQGHNEKQCKNLRVFCYYCASEGNHHTCLCPRKFGDPTQTGSKTTTFTSSQAKKQNGEQQNSRKNSDSEAGGPTNPTPLTFLNTNRNERSILLTAKTVVINPANGIQRKVRLIFDSASHRSYILERTANEMQLGLNQHEKLNVSIFGTTKTLTMDSYQVRLLVVQRNGLRKPIDLHTTKLITENSVLPDSLSPMDRGIIKSMGSDLADDFADSDPSTQILIGSDYFWDFVVGDRKKTNTNLLFITSKLGLLLAGRYENDSGVPDRGSSTMLCLTESFDQFPSEVGLIAHSAKVQPTYPDIDQYWNLETIGIREDPVISDDEKASKIFEQTVEFRDGRYQVSWPWIEEMKSKLPINYELSMGRLKSLGKRIEKDNAEGGNLLQKYLDVIDLQVQRGIVEKVPASEVAKPNGVVHYLPHHPVITPQKTTTKLRIVYDASSKTRKTDSSLNECLYRGPVILPDLCGLLIRFRMNEVAILADIEKAFLQLSLKEPDRDVTRFLWFKDQTNPVPTTDNLEHYRFCRVPFGIISSPFLLGATIQYHLKHESQTEANQLARNIYVDNVITGCKDADAATKLYWYAKDAFDRAGMNLTEWCSNSEEVIGMIPEKDRAKNITSSIQVLGMKWDHRKDTLQIAKSFSDQKLECGTKRQLLRTIASIFDPLGLFQPVMLPAKCFLQKLWEHKLNWDEEIADELKAEWKEVYRSLVKIQEIAVPRKIGRINSEETDISIVAFSDASKNSYAACVYVRARENNRWKVDLVFAKSRLCPGAKGKEITLPRLELMGLAIASKAGNFVRNAICASTDSSIRIHLFTDSECVLAWLHDTNTQGRFVRNRIEEIKSINRCEFRHVRSEENPADKMTRGVTATDLSIDEMWWKGPQWLAAEIINWPESNVGSVTTETLQRDQKKCENPSFIGHTLLAGEVAPPNRSQVGFLDMDINRFSSLRRLLRVTVLCLKFLKKRLWQRIADKDQISPEVNKFFESIPDKEFVTAECLENAKNAWIKSVQMNQFEDVSNAIKLGKKHGLVIQLGLMIDSNGIIRSRSRFDHADLVYDSKYPKLLPKNHPFTILVIRETHERSMHVGVSHTLSEIRREFWIPSGRAVVRRIIRNCIRCRKQNGPSYPLPQMPSWPLERVCRSSPFNFTGLDYFGPVKVKISDETQKMWVCLFTCLSTRAVHLECVWSCSAEDFLNCLVRFVSRRGTPNMIISDNAAQFSVANAVYHRQWDQILSDESVVSYLADKRINWKFITQLAPWQGGFYERLVGVVKSTMKTAIGRRLLKWQEFVTLCAEVEAIVNSRPITYVYDDVSSNCQILRPIDFLTDLPAGVPTVSDSRDPMRDLGDAGKSLARYWKQKRKYLDNLWSVWYQEYLLSLRERGKNIHRNRRHQAQTHPTVGEVVLVRDDDLPRGAWKLARITELMQSADGQIRSVELTQSNGVKLRRAVNYVYPLEIDGEPNQVNNDEIVVPLSDDQNSDDGAFYGFTDADVQRTNDMLQRFSDMMDSRPNDAAMCAGTTDSANPNHGIAPKVAFDLNFRDNIPVGLATSARSILFSEC